MIEQINQSLKTISLLFIAAAATVAPTNTHTTKANSAATTVTMNWAERLRGKFARDSSLRFTGDCVHGRRPTSLNQSTCDCFDKWSGWFCDRPICVHGNLDMLLECICSHGWTGVHCDTLACGANGAVKIWIQQTNFYICQCDDGFNGARCEYRTSQKHSTVEKHYYNEDTSGAFMFLKAICALMLLIMAYGCTSRKLEKYNRRRYGDDQEARSNASANGSRDALPSQVSDHPLLLSPFARVSIKSDSFTDLPPSYDDATDCALDDQPPSYDDKIFARYLKENNHANVQI